MYVLVCLLLVICVAPATADNPARENPPPELKPEQVRDMVGRIGRLIKLSEESEEEINVRPLLSIHLRELQAYPNVPVFRFLRVGIAP